MISIVARKTTRDDICSLNVYIKNRAQNINTYVSMKVKMPSKEWNQDMQLPKRFADERPVKDLGGMSYAELGNKILSIRKKLVSMEECRDIDVNKVKSCISSVMNEAYIKEVEALKESTDKPQQSNEKTMTVVAWVKEFIRQCESGERLKRRSTRRVTEGTIRNYRGTLTQLEEYEKDRHILLDFDNITLNFYDDWKQYFIKKEYSPNTIGRHVKNLKIFLYAADDMKLTTCQEFKSRRFAADHEDVDNVYITTERLKEMAAFDMSDYKTVKELAKKYAKDEAEAKSLIHGLKREVYRKNLAEARDIFVMGCLTGQRVSDYKRLTVDMVEQLVEGRDFLHIVQVKTGKDVYVPYTEIMKTILERYDGELPKIQDQHLNERIKVVGLLLGWTEPAGLTERRGLLEYKSEKRFCDSIKTHTARRTFATNAYKSGVSLSSIMAVTGHSSEAMLRKYLKLDNKERAIIAAEEFEKLKVAK